MPTPIAAGVFGRVASAIEDFTLVPAPFVGGGDQVVVMGRYGGVVKASGAPLDAQFCHAWRFEDGRIVRSSSTPTRCNGCG